MGNTPVPGSRLALVVTVAFVTSIGAHRARTADFAFPEPTDVRTILLSIAREGRLNIVLGERVEGLTTYVTRDRAPLEAAIEAATQAGFTVRVVGDLLAVRVRTICPTRVAREPIRFFEPGEAITLTWARPTCARAILKEVGRILDRPVFVNEHTRGVSIVSVAQVDARVFLNLFCEANGFDWGTSGRAVVVAPYRRRDHYEIEMRLDRRGS